MGSFRFQVTEFNSDGLNEKYKKASVEQRMKGPKDEEPRAINGGKLLRIVKLEGGQELPEFCESQNYGKGSYLVGAAGLEGHT